MMSNKTKLLKAAETVKEAQIKVGHHPRFTKIWVVTTQERVFCRNSTGKEGGWYTALLKKPNAILKLGEEEFSVVGTPPPDLDKVVSFINKAYKKKYGRKFNLNTLLAWEFTRKKYWDKTIELK